MKCINIIVMKKKKRERESEGRFNPNDKKLKESRV